MDAPRDLGALEAGNERAMAEDILSALPVLVRSDGSVTSFRGCEEELRNLVPEGDDVYIVGPHGEVLPMLANAIRRRLWGTKGIFLHVDAHLDNEGEATQTRRVSHPSPGMSVWDAPTNVPLVRSLLRESKVPEPGEPDPDFLRIVEEARHDIATFIASLEDHFDVAAVIRPERSGQFTAIGPMPIADYVKLDSSVVRDPDLLNVVRHRADDIRVIDIDGDVTGVCRNANAWQKFLAGIGHVDRHFRKYMHVVERLVATFLRHRKSDDPVLYTVSVDPEWVRYPLPFLHRFLRDVVPIIQGRSSPKRTGAGERV